MTKAKWAEPIDALRERPKWMPPSWWKRIVLSVIDLEKLRSENDEIRGVSGRKTRHGNGCAAPKQ